MNLFYEDYPTSILVDGQEVQIVTDFRDYIRLFDMLKDDSLSCSEKAVVLGQYFRTPPSDLNAAIEGLLSFVSMEELPKCGIHGSDRSEEEEARQKEVYSFSIDYPFIFSAFLREYQINLRTIEYMHWWEFRMLFDGLPDDTEIKKRIMYRGLNLNEIKDRKERKRIERIQNQIRLPDDELSDYDIGDAFEW